MLDESEWDEFSEFCECTEWIEAWRQGENNNDWLVMELDGLHGEGMRHKFQVIEQQLEAITAKDAMRKKVRKFIEMWRTNAVDLEDAGEQTPDWRRGIEAVLDDLEGLIE